MIILLIISLLALILPLILRDKLFVRSLAIAVFWFVLLMFFVGVQTSSRVAISDKYHKDNVVPSEDWQDGAVQARLEATRALPVAAISVLGLSILAALPLREEK